MFKSIITNPVHKIARLAPSAPVYQRAFFGSGLSTVRQQFVIIAKDYDDEEALTRRLSVRPAHLAATKDFKASGKLILGGAIMSETGENGKMIGSVMIMNADSEQEVQAILEKDPYVTGKVWESCQILPFRTAKWE
ncbi:hypothetical protein BGZ98_000840 [Dissophora globulifera]|nr:hypothetical protein BGZ98_000840 [Dissophora globulifera]